MTGKRLTRRRLVELGLALPLPLVLADDALPATLRATPACDDDPTLEQTEGPFYTPRSPRRRVLVTPGMAGTRLIVTGRVLTTRCKPVPRALLDFWQADSRGVYDNEGYRLRGHQFTDARGRYRLETIVPAPYTPRTRHIHVKVKAPRKPVLTTQLYFPREPRNLNDAIFDAELLLRSLRKASGRWTAQFDFVVDSQRARLIQTSEAVDFSFRVGSVVRVRKL